MVVAAGTKIKIVNKQKTTLKVETHSKKKSNKDEGTSNDTQPEQQSNGQSQDKQQQEAQAQLEASTSSGQPGGKEGPLHPPERFLTSRMSPTPKGALCSKTFDPGLVDQESHPDNNNNPLHTVEQMQNDGDAKRAKWMELTEHEYYYSNPDRAEEMLRVLNGMYGGAHPTQAEQDHITTNVVNNVPRKWARNPEETETANRRELSPEVTVKSPRTKSLVTGGKRKSKSKTGVVLVKQVAKGKKRKTKDQEEKVKKADKVDSNTLSGKKCTRDNKPN
ncbi:uncharacterized protein MELLADRAFT_105161 [Melampsora larici-populina 98AG31]|uniref:Uncharacterized protein n=1 Tax=Melampsora larici-populina (strain 98AG31 / pathotype 3-4-7) TaxID=747676 RepID=F4RGU0_MELLP|nr:uncharacterized protein MELLADRAFT_105161 [Melampsora larici-populina 98AG31]EGG08335.1 hypothetical protein MELLADRAFT_105161 [Melampsora larici-populina 98AG31]